MYSDFEEDDLPVYYSDSSSTDREKLRHFGSLEDQDRFLERHYENTANAELAYFYIFGDPDSHYQRTFGAEFNCEEIRDEVVLFEPVAALLQNLSAQEKTETQSPQLTFDDAESNPTKLYNSFADEEFIYSPSPASRFMCNHLDSCILIPVPVDTNRKMIRAKVKELLSLPTDEEEVDFGVGYVGRDASGWALPLSVDLAILSALKKHFPGYRAATEDDAVQFMRAKRVTHSPTSPSGRQDAGSIASAEACRSIPRLTKLASHQMRDVDGLLKRIEGAGGWSEIIFVAFDVESFFVSQGSIPCPSEFAFVPVRMNPEKTEFIAQADEELSFLLHPGNVSSNALRAIYAATNITGIPYRNSLCLRTDYAPLANLVRLRFLDNPNVILINKGAPLSPTVMDLMALCYLDTAGRYVKAKETGTEEAVTARSPLSICCYDIAALEAALERQGRKVAPPAEDTASESSQSRSMRVAYTTGSCCFYHEKMNAGTDAGDMTYHCARADSVALANRLRADLESLLS